MNEDVEFFEDLRVLTRTAFHESPIYQKQNAQNEQWGFSICGTPIQKGKGILFGINWGGTGEYVEQATMQPEDDFLTYNFVRRSLPFFDKHLSLKPDKDCVNYTNLCFFRTPNLSYLSFEDYVRSYPLFKKYIEYIKPPWIFCLGIKSCDILINMGKLPDLRRCDDKEKKYWGAIGKFLGYNFYAIPHPNAHLTTNSRNEIWKQVGEQFLNDMKL